MIKDIRRTAKMLVDDYYNPELRDLLSEFNPCDFGFDDYSKNAPENFIKDRIYVTVDFYERFCNLLEKMMEISPEFDVITFRGP